MRPLTRFPVTADSTRGGGLADLDGDGDLDLVIANSRGEPVAIYFNNGRGVFAAGEFGMTPLPDETIAGFELVDLDEDGDLDVYLPNAGALRNRPRLPGRARSLLPQQRPRPVSRSAHESHFLRPPIPRPTRRSATSMAMAISISSSGIPERTVASGSSSITRAPAACAASAQSSRHFSTRFSRYRRSAALRARVRAVENWWRAASPFPRRSSSSPIAAG